MDVGADQPYPHAEGPAWTRLPGDEAAHLWVVGWGGTQLAVLFKNTSPYDLSESVGLEHVL